MKNTLALLVTLILTFSCFGVLGMGTVSAEDTESLRNTERSYRKTIFLLTGFY